MATASPSQTSRRPTWRRRLVFLSGGLLALIIVGYFVLTSSAFFRNVILPRVGSAVGGEVTVAVASISPFSQVKLRQLTVRTTGAEPLLQAEEVIVRYSLLSILGGTLKVDEVTIASPVVQLIENADGSSNLDSLLKNQTNPVTQPAPRPAPSKPPQLDVKNVALKNATVRRTRTLQDGGREIVELTGMTITLDQLKNGQPGKLTSAASFKMIRPTNDLLEAGSIGSIEFTLGPGLIPQTLKASVEQRVLRAEGSLRELAGVRTLFTGDVTPTEVKEFSQRFLRGEKLLGEVKVTGPLDLSKKEGRLKMEVASIDQQVLNLLGAPFGLDFGTTTLNATTEVALTQGGSIIAAKTLFRAAAFSVTQKGQTTPPLDFQLACNVTVNRANESAQVQTFTLDGTQRQKSFLRGSLAKPMSLAWGKNAPPAGDSTFELAVTDVDLAAWKSYLGDVLSAGRLSAQLKLVSEQGGKQLKLGLASQIAALAVNFGAQPLTQAALALRLDGQMNDFKKVSLTDYRLDLTQQAQPVLTVSGSAAFDGAAFNLQTQVAAIMARLLGSGSATPFTAGLKLSGSFTNRVLDFHQVQLALAPTQRAPKNDLNVEGRFDLSSPEVRKGRVAVRADALDLTQLYDAFAGEKRSATTPADAPRSSRPASAGNVEPEPVKLRLQLAVEANVARVYLHEIDLQHCQVTAKVDGGKVALDPCRLTLNGAPVNAKADVDLGIKGYAYALSLQMDKVPLEPIANTFSPANRGQYQGLILANAQIKGAGLTGASLNKTLSGQAGFTFTNANLQLIGPKARLLLVPVATLLQLPEITRSPLSWLNARAELGGGNINLSRVMMQSEAFEATASGAIPIAEVLTNSPLNLPVEFALRRSLAEKAGLLPPNTPTNTPYVVLPRFVTIKGTLGEPKSDLNHLALGGLLLKSGLGAAGKFGVNLGAKTSNLLQGAGGFLTGQKPANTNQPATNPPSRLNPLDLFRKK